MRLRQGGGRRSNGEGGEVAEVLPGRRREEGFQEGQQGDDARRGAVAGSDPEGEDQVELPAARGAASGSRATGRQCRRRRVPATAGAGAGDGGTVRSEEARRGRRGGGHGCASLLSQQGAAACEHHPRRGGGGCQDPGNIQRLSGMSGRSIALSAMHAAEAELGASHLTD